MNSREIVVRTGFVADAGGVVSESTYTIERPEESDD